MMELEQKNTFIRGALLLTLAGLFGKILSAAYRIPLQNLTGDHGFYIYQQVYPFLGMILILSLYGLPSAIAKIIADFQRRQREVSFQAVYKPIFILLFIAFSLLAGILFFAAEALSLALGDPGLTSAYKLVAISLLLIPLTALLRGIAQGFSRSEIFAYSQIGEQLIRVAIIITAAILIATGFFKVYSIGVFGVLASIIGAITAIIILLFLLKARDLKVDGTREIPWQEYAKTLLLFGIFGSLNHMILLLMQFADVFTLVPQLVKAGWQSLDAMELKGVFDRGMPLVQVGVVAGSSFALALVPTIAGSSLSDSRQAIESSLKISFFISLGASLGLILIFEETNVLLFKDALGTISLQILSLSIVLSSMTITSLSILQSLGHFKWPGIFIIGSFVSKWVLNLLLVPHFQIVGSALSTVVSLSLLLLLSLFELRRQIPGLRLFSGISALALTLALTSMTLYLLVMKTFLPYSVFSSRLGLFVYVLVLVLGGALAYLFFLLRFGAFTREEIETFPFASLLERIYKGRD